MSTTQPSKAGRERAPGIVALLGSMSSGKVAESMTHDRPSPQNAFVGWGFERKIAN
jgi:hypothetical protein